MANKNMTRAQALELAIAAVDNAEAVAILEKMHAQVTKPRKRSDAPSKARVANEALAAAAVEAMEGHEAVTTKWICEHVRGILTPQKCTAVMRIAVDDGRVIRSKDGKAVTYSLA